MKTVTSHKNIEKKIFVIRGKRVMLDRHLAELYKVETYNLNKAVKRNLDRFPSDFSFTLSKDEYESLRFHFGILEIGKHSKYLPRVFTEQGVAMLSSVLRSKRAVQVNIQIMRAFVKFRELISAHKDLAKKLKELEAKIGKHDKEIQFIFSAIQSMMEPAEELEQEEIEPKRRIGFH